MDTSSYNVGEAVASNVTMKNVPTILDGKFFEIVSQKDLSVKAKCQLCVTKGRPASKCFVHGSLQPTSNFTTHLKRKHPEGQQLYEEYKNSLDVKAKRSRQALIPFPVVEAKPSTETRSEANLIDYIVNSMCPLASVEKIHFRKYSKGLNEKAATPTRKTIKARINARYNREVESLRKRMEKVAWICCTADIWSSSSRSFMGVTGHWLNENFQRESVVLSLKRFAGRHTNDKVAELLSKILKTFGIEKKTVAIVTDNGSNFVKAFEVYGLDQAFLERLDEDEMEDDEGGDGKSDSEPEEEEMENVDLQTDLDLEVDEFNLPAHIRCASHTLSLIATKDVDKETSSILDGKELKSYKRAMRSAFGKCTALWNKAGYSIQTREAYNEITGKAINRPNATRWNATFDAIESLLKVKDSLPTVFAKAGVEVLTDQDIQFLEEYCIAMKPIAWALDVLQGENEESLYGHFAPIIWKAYNDLNQIINADDKKTFSVAIAERLREGLATRFRAIIQLDLEQGRNEVLAAILLPWFKLRWLPESERKRVKQFFIEECEKFQKKMEPTGNPKMAAEANKWDEYFGSDNCSDGQSPESSELNCISYLQDPAKSLESINRHPVLRSMSLMYNTLLPTSAASERVFSYAKMILRPQRNRVSDGLFDQLVFLKILGLNKEKLAKEEKKKLEQNGGF